MLNKIKNALYRFMAGRYGNDQLSRFLIILSFVCILLSYIIRSNVRIVFLFLFWALVIYVYFRMFSRNIYKRSQENTKYVNKMNYLKQRFTDLKKYKYFNCPKCKTHLRVPRGAGKITITCKKCGHQFDGRA